MGINLLRRRYNIETFCYFYFEMDYKPFLQATANDCAQVARALLLYLLRAYLFANGDQTVYLRWLALFRDRDFGPAQEANWG